MGEVRHFLDLIDICKADLKTMIDSSRAIKEARARGHGRAKAVSQKEFRLPAKQDRVVLIFLKKKIKFK